MGVLEITLFVDVVSPFAYEGFHILRVSHTTPYSFSCNIYLIHPWTMLVRLEVPIYLIRMSFPE